MNYIDASAAFIEIGLSLDSERWNCKTRSVQRDKGNFLSARETPLEHHTPQKRDIDQEKLVLKAMRN